MNNLDGYFPLAFVIDTSVYLAVLALPNLFVQTVVFDDLYHMDNLTVLLLKQKNIIICLKIDELLSLQAKLLSIVLPGNLFQLVCNSSLDFLLLFVHSVLMLCKDAFVLQHQWQRLRLTDHFLIKETPHDQLAFDHLLQFLVAILNQPTQFLLNYLLDLREAIFNFSPDVDNASGLE